VGGGIDNSCSSLLFSLGSFGISRFCMRACFGLTHTFATYFFCFGAFALLTIYFTMYMRISKKTYLKCNHVISNYNVHSHVSKISTASPVTLRDIPTCNRLDTLLGLSQILPTTTALLIFTISFSHFFASLVHAKTCEENTCNYLCVSR